MYDTHDTRTDEERAQEVYIKKRARMFFVENNEPGGEEHQKLRGFLDSFKSMANLRGFVFDYEQLDVQAVQLFVQQTGCTPEDVRRARQGHDDLGPEQPTRPNRKQRRRMEKVINAAAPVVQREREEGDSDEITAKKLLDDFELFCAQCIKIRYRRGMGGHASFGGYGPFILTGNQKKLASLIIDIFFNKEKPGRFQILKSRQLGFTTLLNAMEVWLCMQIPGFTVMFMIDKDVHMAEKRNEIIRWVEEATEKYPELPGLKRRAGKVLEFDNGARILLESGMAPNPGTSEMLDMLHLSERPKYPKNRSAEIKASIFPTLQDKPYTLLVDESTAEGNDDFKLDWDRLHSGEQYGSAEIIPVFFAWFTSLEYTEVIPSRHVEPNGRLRFLNEDLELSEIDGDGRVIQNEQEYAEKYKLTDEQVYWRRMQIKGKYNGDKAIFDQEYPTTADHAWSAIGARYIGSQIIKQLYHWSRDPIFIGDIQHDGGPIGSLDLVDSNLLTPKLIKQVGGILHIWQMPVQDKTYYIGGDVAEGKLITQGTRVDSDYCTIYVLDEYGADCALLRARISPDIMPLYLCLLGKFYLWARVNCERNKDGATVFSRFKNMRYPNVYYRETERGQMDDLAWSIIGPSQRKPFLNVGRTALREDPSRVRSIQLCKEAESLVRDRHGKVQPQGEHDDVFMGRCHAEVCRKGYTNAMMQGSYEPPDEEEELPDNTFGAMMKYNGVDFFDSTEIDYGYTEFRI